FASTEPLAPGGATPACRGGSDPTYSGGVESLEQRAQIHRAGRSNRTESAWRAIPGDTPCQGFRHGHSAGYAGKHIRRNAHAGILDTEYRLGLLAMQTQFDSTAQLGVFGRVVQEIQHHLSKSGRIRLDMQGLLLLEREVQLMRTSLDKRATALHSVGYDVL